MKFFSTILLSTLLIIPGHTKGSNDSGETKTETRIYKVMSEEYEIPMNPKRIVADYYIGELLKLEANLVGADLTYTSSAWENELGNIADVGQSLESFMALRPDLIITINEQKLEQYSEIAPTILLPYGTYNPEELIRELSIISNTEDIAEQWLDQFNDRIGELRSMVPDKKEKYTIIDIWGGAAYLYGEHYGRGGYILYNKLGLSGTEDGEREYIRKADSYLNLTVESLPDFAGDILLVMSNGDIQTEGSFFMNTVIWKNLPAVINEKVLYLNSEDFWFTDPFSLDLQVDILKKLFRERRENS